MRNKWLYISTLLLIVVYFKGAIGLASTNIDERNFYLKFTALNILATTIIALSHHKNWTIKAFISFLLIVLFGFFIEVLGVTTGYIFGDYYYGNALGYKIIEVPVIIGINWLLLVYIISAVLHRINNIYLFTILAAGIMTTLDFLIEPVAVKLDFWQWNNGIIPIQNYAAWFVLSGLLFYFARKLNGKIYNSASSVILLLQFIFFFMLNKIIY